MHSNQNPKSFHDVITGYDILEVFLYLHYAWDKKKGWHSINTDLNIGQFINSHGRVFCGFS
jgi:hypothetical protein